MFKQFIILIFLQFFFAHITAQNNESPFLIEASYKGDIAKAIDGGVEKKKPAYLGQIDFSLDFNTETARWWKGGSFYIHLQNNHRHFSPSSLAGDLQVFSNIETDKHTGIFEFYYTQQVGKFTFKGGWNDLNADFYWTEFGGLFLNSSFGISPGASLNVPVSIFPVTSPFLYAGYAFNQFSKLQFSMYAGNPGDLETNPYNVEWNLSEESGTMNILEYQYLNTDKNYLGLKTGFFLHTADVHSLEDTNNMVNNRFGFYALLDKCLIAPSGNAVKGLDAFLQLDIDPSDRCWVERYYGAGISYRGFIAREKIYDQFGIAIAHIKMSKHWVGLSENRKSNETAIEFTYQLNIAEHLMLQPDLQYIINPGAGSELEIKNTFVGIFRLILAY